jgi:hypothetical protein
MRLIVLLALLERQSAFISLGTKHLVQGKPETVEAAGCGQSAPGNVPSSSESNKV